MWRAVLVGIGVLYLAVSGYMWFAPTAWYANTPGVAMMGAYNLHFIRDLALVFLVSGGGLTWGAFKVDRSVALMGAIWPCLHALFHIWIWIARGMPADTTALVNWVGIQAPAWLALVAAHKYPVGRR